MQVVASAYAQYYIFAFVLFAAFCAVSTGIFYADALTFNQNQPIRQIFEVPRRPNFMSLLCLCARLRFML